MDNDFELTNLIQMCCVIGNILQFGKPLISDQPLLTSCPCKNRPFDFRPKTEFLQIFRVRPLVHKINKNGNNLAFNAIFQYFWRQFQRTVQTRLNRSVSSQI